MSKTEYRVAERTHRPQLQARQEPRGDSHVGLGRDPNRGRLRFSAARFILIPLGAQRWETDARDPIDGHSVLHAEANPVRME